MPVGYPSVYSIYLAKKQGTFATLGLAEDTWALNEGVLSDDHFIQQCLDMDDEREAMFLDALDKVPRGLVACVFDGTDRLQHTFWRDIDETHPARPDPALLAGRNVIEDLYRRMDDLVGKTMAKCRDEGTLLMVISDHGFGPFRTGVDLNRWLEENGYLTVDDARARRGAPGRGRLVADPRLRHRPGRHLHQPEGQVRAGHRRAGRRGRPPARARSPAGSRRWSTRRPARAPSSESTSPASSTAGPYKDNAPDLIVGYQRGYRVSWEAAIGKTTDGCLPPQHQGVERRPLRRPVARARHPVLQPPDRRTRTRA